MTTEWKSFTVAVPGKDILRPVRDTLETLLVFLEVLKAILETVKAFLIDFGNPIRALVEALIRLIEELFLALKQSGVFMYIDAPDPNFGSLDSMRGGYTAFTQRFIGSLFDTKDYNRPQPRAGSNMGGFVILMVDAPNAYELLASLKKLYSFFGRGFETPRYLAPANVKAIPVGASGDPILAAASVFTEGPINAIQLQWSLPTTQETHDPGFFSTLQKTWSEFVYPSFLIEVSEGVNPMAQKIQIGDINTSTGIVEYNRPLKYERFGTSTTATVKEVLHDDSGEPFVKFSNYWKLSTAEVALGHLGKFRFIHTDAEPGKEYYYRVRAYSGTLSFDANNKLIFPDSYDKISSSRFSSNSQVPCMVWPGKDLVMGKPSPVVRARVPVDTGDFDAVSALQALFKTAFSLDFHLELPSGATFDSSGNPTGTTSPTMVGRGSLVDQSGILAGFQVYADMLEKLPFVGTTPSAALDWEIVDAAKQPNAVSGDPFEMPWLSFNVRRHSARLADIVVSAMLDLDSSVILGLRDLMRGPLPKGKVTVKYLSDKATLEEVVFKCVETEEVATNQTSNSGGAGSITVTTAATSEAIEAYAGGYQSVVLRQNVLEVINYIKNFTLGGVPNDWISVVPLRDIIPWSGAFLYDLLDKIQALLDAFNGVMKEIRDFIDLLIKKINALEAFIQYLIDILNFVESLEISAYRLSVPSISGSASAWASAINTAGGVRPTSGPGGYSAGLAFAYVAPDITAFQTAFSLIFGG